MKSKDIISINQSSKPSDCEIIIGKLDNTVGSLGNCIDVLYDEKKTKMHLAGSIIRFGASLTKFTFSVLGCAIKNIPKAVVVMSSVKRDIVTEIEKEWNQHQKQLKEEFLNEKIKLLKVDK